MLAHGEPTNDDRLESNGANEALGDGDRFQIIAGDRHSDPLALAMRDRGQPPRADRVEAPYDAGARQ
jgi:hypothetical protein